MSTLPRVISKAELAIILGCVTASGKHSTKKLNKYYLTKEVIEEVLEMDLSEFKKIRVLSPKISQKIYDHFKIEFDEWEDAFKPG